MAQATSHAPATACPPRVCTLVPFIIILLVVAAMRQYMFKSVQYFFAIWDSKNAHNYNKFGLNMYMHVHVYKVHVGTCIYVDGMYIRSMKQLEFY